jgi:hypothetical protein
MQLPHINVFDCLAISCFLYLLVVFRDYRRRRGLPYPPGPPPLPIIGNLLDVPGPKDLTWSAYAEMSKKHGMHIILWDWDTSSPPAQTHIPRRRYLFSRFLSGRRRAVFTTSH